MRPTPIPDEDIPEGARRLVLAAPNGSLTDEEVGPLEVVVLDSFHRGRIWQSRWIPNPEEIQRLQNGEPIWVSIWSPSHPPISVDLAEFDVPPVLPPV